MDEAFRQTLRDGIAALGLPVGDAALGKLEAYADLLLKWNRKVNLTAVTDPAEVAEKHFVDSLALLPHLGPARTLLDLGSGAGLPGAAVAIARPGLEVTCCDAVAKKMAFVKAAAAALDLPVRAIAVRAEGHPEWEGLPRADVVVSRALMDPDRFLPLARAYLAPGGIVLAMLGREADPEALRALGAAQGLVLEALFRFELPRSRARRAIARFRLA